MKTRFQQTTLLTFVAALALLITAAAVSAAAAAAAEPEPSASAPAIKVIPTPKRVIMRGGAFLLNSNVYILPARHSRESDRFAATLLQKEFKNRTGLEIPIRDSLQPEGKPIILGTLNDDDADALAARYYVDADAVQRPESYTVNIAWDSILLLGADPDGTFYAVQTLRQIIRTNPDPDSLPTLRIDDYPSFSFRGITDDISRGPVPTMETIKQTIARLSEYKINKFNFYIEHVFCYKNHPDIGPVGGCLSADDIREIDAYAKQYHIELVGGQQSFGHLEHVLDKPKYMYMAESPLNPYLISPANKDTYKFLGELYDEIAPAFSSKLFNISCDETQGLGDGQSKALVEKEGVGPVYAGHIIKVHDMLASHGKRIMMWADIALKYPEMLGTLPGDIIFLPWGYSPEDNFNHMLDPISKTGHDFIVCPGVNCWGRMFPNIDNAIPNISHFSRDGYLHHALGVLNTTWDDDGENLFGYNWYPLVWGAETSWNPYSHSITTFNEKFSQSFYGTPDDSAALGIAQFTEANRTMDFANLGDDRYWPWPPNSTFPSSATAMAEAKRLLSIANAAEAKFLAAKKSAIYNQENLDYPLFAARRMQELARRRLSYYENARRYGRILKTQDNKQAVLSTLAEMRKDLEKTRDGVAGIFAQYRDLWLHENRPYWLDNNKEKYDGLIARIDAVIAALDAAEKDFKNGAPLPSAKAVGLPLPEVKNP